MFEEGDIVEYSQADLFGENNELLGKQGIVIECTAHHIIVQFDHNLHRPYILNPMDFELVGRLVLEPVT